MSRTSAYVDTSAFISALDRSDSFHPLFRQLFSNPPPLITSPLVIAEGQAWFLRRFDINRALQFMLFIEELKVLKVVDIGASEISSSTKILRKFSDQGLTLADAVGIDLMRQYKIRRCWSTDHHLSLTGIPLIISSVE